MAHNTKDLTGQRFGRLVVLARAPHASQRAHWRCRCDCGTETVKNGKYLLCGDTSSCGCEQREYRAGGNPKYAAVGIAKHAHPREYSIFRAMKSRCHTPSSSNYRFYGGKGTHVCQRWRDSFIAFLDDMGPCPEGYTLDRIDPSGHYEPGNCRWATWDTQHNNTTFNVTVTLHGVQMTAARAMRRLGVPKSKIAAVYYRLRRGDSFKEAAREHYAASLSSPATPGAR